jgi:hypothetical protein
VSDAFGLTREGLQVLELIPYWRERSKSAVGGSKSPLLIMGLVSASAEKALWANIARAARRLGIDAQYLDGAAIASGHQIDLCVSELVDQQPECVLLFGESLLQEIKRIRPELLEGRQLIVCDDFSTLTAQSTRKSAVWQALVKLRSVLHSSPQS